MIVARWAGSSPAGPGEALCAAVAAAAWWCADTVALAACGALLGWWCVCLSVVDARTRRLPNALTLGGFGAVVAAAAAFDRTATALAGAAMLAVPYLVVHLAVPAAMGAGDVKLALGVGAAATAAGAHGWLAAAAAAPLVTALVGVASAVRAWHVRREPARHVPHGPAMCGATAIAVAAAWW
ncbi:prepilin peptidase [Rhodococcus sp. HNM0569]|nr:prepilin peptidase [Rhodococcus sp. HNM0569]